MAAGVGTSSGRGRSGGRVLVGALAVSVVLPLVAPGAEALTGGAGAFDVPSDVAALEAQTSVQGCDPIDAANCLLPFPSDHFTTPVEPGEIGGTDRGGTGRRVDFSPLSMPRNALGKPIDPSEWNRNDGFSPGQLILTHVPDLAVERDENGEPLGPVVGAPPITDPAQYADPDTSVVVIDVETGQRHPIWVETDVNAGYLFPPGGERKPGEATPALMIRPAENFREGARYVVALRDLQDDQGETISAGSFFAACRDGDGFPSPGLSERCEQLGQDVFPVLDEAGIDVEGNGGLHSAWDFTVASTSNNVGRLRHMRDEAFAAELGQVEDDDGGIIDRGRVPDFEVTDVYERSDYREIHGSLTVPSFVVPEDPSPLETSAEFRQVLSVFEDEFPGASEQLAEECRSQAPDDSVCALFDQATDGSRSIADAGELAGTVSLPPNRLFYDPSDEMHPSDPAMQAYGDGLPDQTGEMEIPWVCRVHDDATADDPARLGTHGHGLLGQRFSFPSQMMREYNHAFCNADWFGFATGDIANVATLLVDASNFPVIPDASQQGMLNKLFLLRMMHHPDGVVSHEAFQDDDGRPRVDVGEIFYYGGSQGGILGGPVVAMSKDVTRGGLRVPGMNYSTLLRRSTGFDPYSMPLYLSYHDDLDRSLVLSLIQMLWDRAENNGYAHHITDNSALGGPDNSVLLGVAFADHQVSHWSAKVMARTIGVDIADFHPRNPAECGGDVQYCFDTREGFQRSGRNPNVDLLWGLPLSDVEDFPQGRDKVAYDDPQNTDPRRHMPRGPGEGPGQRIGPPESKFSDDTGFGRRSGLIMFDGGRTASPPLGNIPANHKDSFDPHGHLPDNSPAYRCLQSHFLHPQGGIIDVRDVLTPEDCPAFPSQP